MTTINGQNPFISNVKKNNVQNDSNNNKTNSPNNQQKSYGVSNESDDSPKIIITDDASDVNEASDLISSMEKQGADNESILKELRNMFHSSKTAVEKTTAEVCFIQKDFTNECDEVINYNKNALKKESDEKERIKAQIEQNNKTIEELTNKEKNGEILTDDEKSKIKTLADFNNSLFDRLNNNTDVTITLNDSSDIESIAAKLSEATGIAQDATEVADAYIDLGEKIAKIDFKSIEGSIVELDKLCPEKTNEEKAKVMVGAAMRTAGKILGIESIMLADKVVDVAFEKNIEIADKSSLNNLANKNYGKFTKHIHDNNGNVNIDGKRYSTVQEEAKMKNADKIKNG